MPMPQCIRIAFNDRARADELIALGWREIEVLETWTGGVPRDVIETERTEIARRDDMEAIQKLAARSFKHDRLHADPLVPAAEADAAKEKWVADAFQGTDRQITVARVNGEVGGFLIYKSWRRGSSARWLYIDLLAVDPRYRKHGLATQLVIQAARAGGFRKIMAGTQEANEPARAFYKSLGMKVSTRQRTFHKP